MYRRRQHIRQEGDRFLTAREDSTALPPLRLLQAKVALREKLANEFQEFFAAVMTLRDPGFRRVRPWGRSGDRKNDGWSPARRILFQVYAPQTMTSSALLSKLNDDYEGAIDFWVEHFSTWIFVHNDFGGLGPDAARLIAQLDVKSHDVACDSWGPDQIINEIGQLSASQLIHLLGPPITRQAFLDVSAQSLQPLFDHLQLSPPRVDGSTSIPVVPIDKMERNGLGEEAQQMLVMGESKLGLVQEYLDRTSADPTHATLLADAFVVRYRDARGEFDSADDVLAELVAWLTGGHTGAAVIVNAYSVLAYYLFTCHIFEEGSP